MPFATDSIGAMFGLYFAERVPTSFAEVTKSDTERFNRFFHLMLDEGVYFAPSAYEAGFVSSTHDDAVIDATLARAAHSRHSLPDPGPRACSRISISPTCSARSRSPRGMYDGAEPACRLRDRQDGDVIGEGFTQPAGQDHAEVQALKDARARGYDVAGSTVYVTLEPCSHFGRTPPCAR